MADTRKGLSSTDWRLPFPSKARYGIQPTGAPFVICMRFAELNVLVNNPEKLDVLISTIMRAARLPGVAIAIVAEGETVFARGYGLRDLEAKLPMTSDTIYPIASTTKAINTTLLGMLVEEGRLAWDAPVQSYLPLFRLSDPFTSTQITLRDLVTMRTGLPRHDWLWLENPIDRAALVRRLRYLELSAGFRERFQYNNLTATTAGHIAEIVTGKSWNELVQKRILEPLGMNGTGFTLPMDGNVTRSYYEDRHRRLLEHTRLTTEVTAPSGGAIHSTVEDMARWILFNLNGGRVGDRLLLQPHALEEIQSPQVMTGTDPSPPTPNAPYAMGWFVDVYNGCARLSHGGYEHDVSSEIALYPKNGIGIVTFTNFGPPSLARLIGQHAFDALLGFQPVQTLEAALSLYEKRIEDIRRRDLSTRRVESTSPSHSLNHYEGIYTHAGYGSMEILRRDNVLTLRRHNLVLPLEHWHYDAWVVAENDLFPIHRPHVFDRASRIIFETGVDGDISAFDIRLEPAVSPIRFTRQAQQK